MEEGGRMRRIIFISALFALAAVLMVPAASLYYESGAGRGCTSCHEMNNSFDRWHSSTHRNIACEKCHGGALTPDLSFHWNNATRVLAHLSGDSPERIGFPNTYVQSMSNRCRTCHQQEYAAWAAGPHGATYGRIFLDQKHNSRTMLMDDCLRCHGMHFDTGINGLVSPLDRKGPWQLKPAGVAAMPSMPCLACHTMHTEGALLAKPPADARAAGPAQEIARPSLAFFDRRTRQYIGIADLPVPAIVEGGRHIRMSKDQRQALCYQCHAPTAAMHIGSGDDRTPSGVHEGISCLACHAQHGQNTRASCATCHPKMSNCGLDVEQMDTTFKSATSKHNIHWVKCAGCHPSGIPRKKVTSAPGPRPAASSAVPSTAPPSAPAAASATSAKTRGSN
jgi:hypothetical protein